MSHAKALYKNNMIGLPTKVSVFDDLPTSVTLSQVNSSAGVSGTKSNIDIAYDETGTRVSYSVKNNGTGIDYTEVSVPGVGVFRSTSGATGFSLDRQDLVAGGFREGNFAYFPVTDAQGNVRGYATTEGLVSAMDYYPYGTVVDLVVDNTDSRSRWQSKEFDGEHGKYYFGARFFDPTFAMWLSPDPAGQFSNPYTYGGDPVNAVDYDGKLSWASFGKAALAVAGLGVAAGVAPAVALGAGMTVDAMAGGSLSMGMLGLSATPAMFTGPASSYLSGGDRNDIGNSFVNGLFMDALGGVASASAMMTTLSHVQRCGYGEDCTKVARDVFHGGFFVDNVGNMIGLGNVKFMGGTADWFELRDINSDWDGVSDYYQGNVVYSRGYLDVVKNFGISGGGDHLGHAVMAVDRENKETIAHELNHVRQTENIGHRWLYLFNYLDNNGWSPFPNDAYYSNKMEMDSYYKAFLYKNGCIDVYGNEIGEWTHEEMSRAFYKGGQYTVNGFTYYRSEGDSYSHKHPEVVYDDWFWYENWWKDY